LIIIIILLALSTARVRVQHNLFSFWVWWTYRKNSFGRYLWS